MSRLFPKPKPAYEAEYTVHCNTNNLKYVTYFSMLSVLVFGFHLIHHFRLGIGAISAEMMPYTLLYSFAIIYPLFNILFLHKLKDIPALTPVARFIETLFPFFMGSIAVILSALSSLYGLGVTPFAIIMMVICFTLQGQFILLSSVVGLGFWVLSIVLLMYTEPNIYSPLIAISFTTTLACIIIANVTEHMRIRQFEVLTELNANNRQLRLLSQQDHLTQLLNRRAVDQALERELARSERFNHQLSLLIIDVDDFKYLNDAFGHVFGDRILVDIAECIKLHVRDVDYVGRIGGDEFIVILVETNQENAIQIADRMRGEVLQLQQKHQNSKISISIGHASSDGESHIALIEKADKALYLAKNAGKNKVRSIYRHFDTPNDAS
ncbi:GGDEF domain-containing protein [Aliiglaciecola sp. M165]|uniref:GGDEF domain-containing protein n=1 Tax=Aliiglaciecola sp. M165 TaxID=2593649 RepID=UPI00117FA39B|nr:GGDEF domain-containing protein [Aliiglaciecola sp. M165]TRY32902.1 GGDEF domain-containing protein [Aliiglaciecola sp. M165]